MDTYVALDAAAITTTIIYFVLTTGLIGLISILIYNKFKHHRS